MAKVSRRGGSKRVVRDSTTATPPEPAVGTTIPPQAATHDVAYSFAFAAGAFTGPGTYTATKGDGTALPSWLTFTPATRTLAGTPLIGNVGTLAVKITKNDGLENTASQTFNIVIA